MRLKLVRSFPIFLVFAALETIGVASVYPLLSYISAPAELERSFNAKDYYDFAIFWGTHRVSYCHSAYCIYNFDYIIIGRFSNICLLLHKQNC